MNEFGQGLLTIIGGVITIAIVAVVVSKNANTATDVNAIGTNFAKIIAAAVAPSGHLTNGNLGSNTFTTPSPTLAFGS